MVGKVDLDLLDIMIGRNRRITQKRIENSNRPFHLGKVDRYRVMRRRDFRAGARVVDARLAPEHEVECAVALLQQQLIAISRGQI